MKCRRAFDADLLAVLRRRERRRRFPGALSGLPGMCGRGRGLARARRDAAGGRAGRRASSSRSGASGLRRCADVARCQGADGHRGSSGGVPGVCRRGPDAAARRSRPRLVADAEDGASPRVAAKARADATRGWLGRLVWHPAFAYAMVAVLLVPVLRSQLTRFDRRWRRVALGHVGSTAGGARARGRRDVPAAAALEARRDAPAARAPSGDERAVGHARCGAARSAGIGSRDRVGRREGGGAGRERGVLQARNVPRRARAAVGAERGAVGAERGAGGAAEGRGRGPRASTGSAAARGGRGSSSAACGGRGSCSARRPSTIARRSATSPVPSAKRRRKRPRRLGRCSRSIPSDRRSSPLPTPSADRACASRCRPTPPTHRSMSAFAAGREAARSSSASPYHANAIELQIPPRWLAAGDYVVVLGSPAAPAGEDQARGAGAARVASGRTLGFTVRAPSAGDAVD